MQIFPAQYSTLSSAALKDFLSNKYDLVNITCKLLIHNVSDTYLLENASQKCIFKIYRDQHRKVDEIKAEVELLDFLHDRGAKVAYPIANKNGEKLQAFNAIEGIRYGVMFSFAEGEPAFKLSDKQLQLLGREMARLHEITTSVELKYPRKEFNIDTIFNQPLATLKPAFKALPEEYDFLTASVNQILEKLSRINFENFSYGYCQYDFLPKNFHFVGNDKITFFDFDFAGKGYIVNDIASFYVHYFLDVLTGKLTKVEADRQFALFIKSYREVRKFSDEEFAAIPYFGYGFWIFYLGFQYENFDDWSNMFFGTRYLKDRVGILRKWMEDLDGTSCFSPQSH